MEYVTMSMLMEHADKSRSAVIRALKAAGVKMERIPGVQGLRMQKRDANKFLMRQWPKAGPLPIEPLK